MYQPKRRKIALKDDKGQGDGPEGKGHPQLQSPAKAICERRTIWATSCGSPVALLLPEVLELIFKKLESPKDILSCWNTTPAWRAALRSTDFYIKMTLPFLMPYLSQEDLLHCGSVSKTWNAAVDASIEYFEELGSANRLRSYHRTVIRLSAENMHIFLNTFGNESGEKIVVASPIPFRRCKVWLDFPQTLESLEPAHVPQSDEWRNLIKTLDHFGHLIQNLTLNITGFDVDYLNKIILIKRCLERTPNLRVIHIDAPCWGLDKILHDEHPRIRTRLEAFNSESPWPILKHLKVVKFHDDTVQKIFTMIANLYAPQLRYLRLRYHLLESIQPQSERYSCLQKIVFVLKPPFSGVELAAFIESSKCQLKHLTMVCDLDEPNVVDEHPNNFTMIVNSANETLETLVLRPFRLNLLFDVSKYTQLRLPKLKVLVLESFGFPSLSFLHSVCPAMEQLSMEPAFLDFKPWTKPEPIYCDLYSEHEFWSQMTATKRVHIDYMMNWAMVEKTYTRLGYEEKVKRDGINTQADNQASSS